MKTLPEKLKESIEEAVDVSGAFDNCYFHCFAAHLIANGMEFPEDLFTFKSILGEDSPASQLQKRFPNSESLSLFANYYNILNPEDDASHHQFMVEKTLVMGILLREWLATKMASSQTIKDNVCKLAKIKFHDYWDARRATVSIDDLVTGSDSGLLYQSNQAFLEYYLNRPLESLTEEQQRFEDYFQEHGEINKAIEAYWSIEGYENYCQAIANQHTKLSYQDIGPVFEQMGLPMTIYYNNGTEVYDNHIDSDTPHLEIVIHLLDGHYCLIGNEHTAPMLSEYKESYQQYLKRREQILASSNKDELASASPSLLIGAIIPDGHLSKGPYQSLLDKVDIMVAATTPKKHLSEDMLSNSLEEAYIEELSRQIDIFLSQYQNQLNTFGEHSSDAQEAAQTLHDELKRKKIIAFTSASKESLITFRQEVIEALDDKKERLQQDISYWQSALNCVRNILNWLIGHMPFVHNNEFFKPHIPKAFEESEKLQENITNAMPKINM